MTKKKQMSYWDWEEAVINLTKAKKEIMALGDLEVNALIHYDYCVAEKKKKNHRLVEEKAQKLFKKMAKIDLQIAKLKLKIAKEDWLRFATFKYRATKVKKNINNSINNYFLNNDKLVSKIKKTNLNELKITKKDYLITAISNANIEGNTIETITEYKQRPIEDQEKQEIMAIEELIEILEEYDHYELTEWDLKNFHKIVAKPLSIMECWGVLGKYKIENNFIGPGYITCDVLNVETEMSAWLDFYNQKPVDQIDAVLRAGISHIWFCQIHPFSDGNGRLSRLLLSFYFKMHKITQNLIQINFNENICFSDSADYRNALCESDRKNNYKYFLDFYISQGLGMGFI